jgi:hypothetical protein
MGLHDCTPSAQGRPLTRHPRDRDPTPRLDGSARPSRSRRTCTRRHGRTAPHPRRHAMRAQPAGDDGPPHTAPSRSTDAPHTGMPPRKSADSPPSAQKTAGKNHIAAAATTAPRARTHAAAAAPTAQDTATSRNAACPTSASSGDHTHRKSAHSPTFPQGREMASRPALAARRGCRVGPSPDAYASVRSPSSLRGGGATTDMRVFSSVCLTRSAYALAETLEPRLTPCGSAI